MSYGELYELQLCFERQCRDNGIKWLNEEVKSEAFNQFCEDYEESGEEPELMLCGYGYESVK